MHRIIFVIAVFLFSLTSVMGQMIPINLPADGNWPTIVGDSIMIIGPRQNELTEEQRYFNPVYLMTYPGKEHLKAQMIRAGACDCDPTKPNRRIGVFSVAPNKQVSFSQGNLQYLPAIHLWKFADTQYEYLGNANKYLKPTFRNWVDLFGWSANNTTAPFGVSTSTNAADYVGDFVDWGTNTICGDAPNTWRTLSRDEWEYLLNGRENAEQLRTKGSVEGKEGVILLPDSWICPKGYTIAIIPDEANLQPNVNTYSQADWSKLEAAGAIILPSAGMRRHATELEVRHPNIFGGYWTCTNKDEHNSYCYTFHTQDCEYLDYSNHIYGRSVRLVHDTIVPETIPEPCLIVKVNDTLSINMMCVEGGTFMMGAMEGDTQANANEKPAHEVTLSDYYMSDVQVSQALWEYVMGTTIEEEVAKQNGEQNIGKGPNYPMYSIDWFLANEFAAKLSQLTGLQFSLPTEAEWEYAARGGQLSRGYKFAGSNNLDEIAWWGDPKGLVHPSAQKKPNELGIYDMCGNICEWTLDGYSEYTNEAQTDPLVPRVDYVVQRSMSSYSTWKEADHRVTFRYKKDPKVARTRVGFRLVLHDTVPTSPEPEYVDLGLSVKWATFNVGATSPEDYGDYFAWGETEPKETYSWANYKWYDGDYTKLNKYCTKEQYGIVDNQTILQLCDDAAHTKLGGNWRMPTMEECQELVNLCTWTWTTINGINGHVITGPNGNTIFLPATGAITTSGLQHAGESGYYWINSISTTSPYNANDIYNRPPNTEMDGSLPTYGINAYSRYIGRPIRAVYDDRPKSKIIWYTDEAIKEGSNGASGTGMAGWAYLHPEGMETTELNRRYQGKRINCIRLQVAQAGTFTVSVANRDRLDSIFNIQTIMLKDPSKEPQVYHLPQTIHLQKNQVLVFANPTDQARFYYSSYVGDISFADYVGHPSQTVRITAGPKTLNIDAGYYCEDGENCDTLAILEPEYVDLGLSVKWATFNVGATSPEEYGDYFAWGETEPKDEYTWATYKWGNGTSAAVLTKYNTQDGKTILEPEDDAAQVHWGGKWRMPTKEELTELRLSCTWEWITINGITGNKVTGPNGNSIFLPAGGSYNTFDDQLNSVGIHGWIYSSTKSSANNQAQEMGTTASGAAQTSCSRCVGLTIRPVYDDRP